MFSPLISTSWEPTLLSTFTWNRSMNTPVVVLRHTLLRIAFLTSFFLRALSFRYQCSTWQLASFYFFRHLWTIFLVMWIVGAIYIITWLFLSRLLLRRSMPSLVDIVISVISHIPVQREQIAQFAFRSRLLDVVEISESLVKVLRVLLAHSSSTF